jgi:FAD/FMN-containing dehydrogenase
MLTATPFTDLAAQMSGRVVTPSDPDWDSTRQVFNLATDLRPAAVALPRDVSDVIAAVGYARDEGLRVAPQATGHNAAPLRSLEDTLLVDVREFQEVTIDPGTQRVRVGAGVKWERVVPQLSELGLAALHGSSPDVGIAGYSLGGGMGWLARRYGLQTNSVTAIELVTADGRAARVDAEHEPDLFWALRGGSFTVVFGAFLGSEGEGRALLRPVRDLGPAMDTFAVVPPAVLGDMAMDPPDPLPFVSATALLSDLPSAGVDDLVAAAGPGSGSPLAMVELRQLGGALARRSPGAGARATLPGTLAMFALGVAEDEAAAATARTYLDAVERAVLPYRSGDYPNFVEEPTDASAFFDADTLARLRQMKALYDPTDLFKGNHHIPPAE